MPKHKESKVINGRRMLKQEIFCRTWVETLGNACQSALAAFDIKGKEVLDINPAERTEANKIEVARVENVARTMGSEYLTKPNIRKLCDAMLREAAFTDEAVEREHAKIILGAKDETKIRGIDLYYKLKGRLIDTVKHTGVIEIAQDVDTDISEEEQEALLALRAARLKRIDKQIKDEYEAGKK